MAYGFLHYFYWKGVILCPKSFARVFFADVKLSLTRYSMLTLPRQKDFLERL